MSAEAARSCESFRYVLRRSRFGTVALVWSVERGRERIHRVILPPRVGPGGSPRTAADLDGAVSTRFPGARLGSTRAIGRLADRLSAFLEGETVSFSVGLLDWRACSTFQRCVLLAEHAIPRSWVSTYGAIAAHIGVPRGARAVGRALATNPFPLIVPCHRAIGSGGRLGGYQGGLEMKRALLENEGVEFSPAGRVVRPRFFYP